MNANEFTFGIEIETTVSRETITREHLNIAPYHSGGSQVPYLPQGWVAKQDVLADLTILQKTDILPDGVS